MIRRMTMPKTWPLARKGRQKYIITPRGSREDSIALVVVLRDLAGIAKTSNEAGKLLHAGEVFINNKKIIDKAFPVYPFDKISLPRIKRHLELGFKGKKFAVQDIKEEESRSKPYKVIGKKALNKGRIQLNLFQGLNFIISPKEASGIKVYDSVLVDLKECKISKHLPLKEGAAVSVIGGKHIGETGSIKRIEKERDLIFIDTEKGEVRAPKEKILVTG